MTAAMAHTVGVLAHYGGIDEVGVFVVPALAVIWLLRRAEKKARDRENSDLSASAVDEGHPRTLSSQPDE